MNNLPEKPFELIITATRDEHPGNGHVYVCDKSGRKIMALWGTPDEKMALADMIIEKREDYP